MPACHAGGRGFESRPFRTQASEKSEAFLVIMTYSVYIIQSQIDDSFYIGYSQNPESRLIKHNSANKGYTARKKPWKLVYTESFEHKSEAIKREKFLKKQKNKAFYEQLISQAG